FPAQQLHASRTRDYRPRPYYMRDDIGDESHSDEGADRQLQNLGKTAWIEGQEEQPRQYDLFPLCQTVSAFAQQPGSGYSSQHQIVKQTDGVRGECRPGKRGRSDRQG